MNKKKVYLIYDFLTEAGGLERLMAMHGKALQNAGYEVKLLFGCVNPELAKEDVFDGLEVVDFSKIEGGEIRKILHNMLGHNKIRDYSDADCIVSYSFPSNMLIKNLKCKKVMYMNHYPNFLYLPLKDRLTWIDSPKRAMSVFTGFLGGSFLKRIDKKLTEDLDLVFIQNCLYLCEN
ncbi:MAG: hypothetical protein HQ521_15610 [Bacteroidetes bacterium]|nr:hypothetical protein [Bacteroidota bacterium]